VAVKKAAKKSPTLLSRAKSRVIEFPRAGEEDAREQEIETRLQDLTALVADLTDSGYGVLLAEEPSTGEAFDELRVKEAALRWIIRVARHSTGAVRARLWSDVEDAVSGLEKTSEFLLHSGLMWAHAAHANSYLRLNGPGHAN
jgi:hypothetical protein